MSERDMNKLARLQQKANSDQEDLPKRRRKRSKKPKGEEAVIAGENLSTGEAVPEGVAIEDTAPVKAVV